MQNRKISNKSVLNFRKVLEAVTRKGRRVVTNPATSSAFLFFKDGVT